MNRNLILLMLLVLFPIGLSAEGFVSERVFVYPVKSYYQIGDSVEVKGHVLSEDSTFVPHSRYLYLDVIHGDSLVYKQHLRCDDSGTFYTRFPIPPIWKADVYHIRAYTRFMRNYSSRSFPMIPLQIGGRAVKRNGEADGVFCEFYPEGGNLLVGHLQNVTIALKDAEGNPLSLPYYVTSGKDTLVQQQTTESGLQIVRLSFRPGESYFLHCHQNGKMYTFPFPESREGTGLQVFANSRRVTYRVLRSGGQVQVPQKLYVFHSNLGLQSLEWSETGVLDLEGLQEGMLTFFLVDDKNAVVSERSVWVNGPSRGEPRLSGAVMEEDGNIGLHWSSDLPEGATLHVRLLEKDEWAVPYAESSLKWCNGMVSPLDFPTRYFSGTDGERRVDLQAWLQTAVFARFDVKKMLDEGFSYPHYVEQEMALKGRVTDQRQRPLDEGSVTAYHEKSGQFFQSELDDEGNFYIPVNDFANGDEFYLLAKYEGTRPGMKEFRYELLDESIPEIHVDDRPEDRGWYVVIQDSLGMDKNNYGIDKNNLLPEVQVGAKSLVANHESSEKYYGNNYVDAEKIKEHNYSDMLPILRSMPGILVVKNPVYTDSYRRNITTSEYVIRSTRPSTVLYNSDSEDKSITIVLDGNSVGADEIIHLNVHDISSVQYLKPHEALKEKGVFHAIDGALVIKTKTAREAVNELNDKRGGVYSAPVGLSNFGMTYCPSLSYSEALANKGEYRLVVDLLSKEGISSYEMPIRIE